MGITQLPLAGLAPLGILSASQTLDLILRPQVLQYTPDHVHADIRAHILKLGDSKSTRRSVIWYEG